MGTLNRLIVLIPKQLSFCQHHQAGSLQKRLDSFGQHVISPGHLREATRQGGLHSGKDSPIAAFVFISLSSSRVLGHRQ